MLTRLFSLILVFTLLTQSAFANMKSDDLRVAIDELTYALQVEWDQKDKNFLKKEILAFQKKVIGLKEQGKLDLTDYVIDQAHMNLINEGIENNRDLVEVIYQKALRGQKKGASWSDLGYAVESILIAAILVGFVICLSPDACKFK